MNLIKDRKLANASESEILSITFAPRKNLIASCAAEEPVIVRRYPIMKPFKKIFHREKYYFTKEQTDYEISLITPMWDEYKVSILRKKAEAEGRNFLRGRIITATFVKFLNRDRILAIGYENGDLLFYDTQFWRKIKDFKIEGTIAYIQDIPEEHMCLVSTKMWMVYFIDYFDWKIKKEIELKVANTGKVLFTRDPYRFYVIYDKKRVCALDPDTQEILFKYKGHRSGINSFIISPDGKTLATSGCDCKVSLFNIETGEKISYLIGHSDEVYAIVFSKTGKYLLSSSEDFTIRIWDMETHETIKKIMKAPACIAMERYGSLIVSGNVEGEIRTYRFFE